MQILCSTGSVTLNVMATSTHAHSVASTAPLTSAGKWSLFSMYIPVQAPWLTGYIDVTQMVLILTMARLFSHTLDIPSFNLQS